MKDCKRNDPFYTSTAWRKLREQALIRDHYECQQCVKLMEMGKLFRPSRATMVHHIIPRTLRPDLELDLDNLISLCDSCHNKEHPERGFKVQRLEGNQQQRCIRISNERSMDKSVRY